MGNEAEKSSFEEFELGSNPLQSLDHLVEQIGEESPEISIAPSDRELVPDPSWGTLAEPGAELPTDPDVFKNREEARHDQIAEQIKATMSEPPTKEGPKKPKEGLAKRFLHGLQEGRAASEEMKRAEKELQSIDIDTSSPPKNKFESLIGRFSSSSVKSMPLDADPPSSFEQLLVPLRPAEVEQLRYEVTNTQTIFTRMEQARESSARRQRIGILLAIALVAGFFFLFGENYLTETLPSVSDPDWIPGWMGEGTASKIIIALGLLAPLLAVFVFSESIRLLLGAVADRDAFDLMLGCSAGLLGAISLFCLITGAIPWALLFLLLYWICDKAIEGVRDRWKI